MTYTSSHILLEQSISTNTTTIYQSLNNKRKEIKKLRFHNYQYYILVVPRTEYPTENKRVKSDRQIDKEKKNQAANQAITKTKLIHSNQIINSYNETHHIKIIYNIHYYGLILISIIKGNK